MTYKQFTLVKTLIVLTVVGAVIGGTYQIVNNTRVSLVLSEAQETAGIVKKCPSPPLTKDLEIRRSNDGNTGGQVSALQGFLWQYREELGIKDKTKEDFVTGIYGRKVRRAVQRFQDIYISDLKGDEEYKKVMEVTRGVIQNQCMGSRSFVIEFKTPEGGEVWQKGDDAVIQWSVPPPAKDSAESAIDIDATVDLYLVSKIQQKVLNARSSYLITTETVNDGLYKWRVPENLQGLGVSEGQYSIRLQISGTDRLFESDTFSIATVGGVSVTDVDISPSSPDIGDSVRFSLSWDDSESESVKVHFCKTNEIFPNADGGGCVNGTWFSSVGLDNQNPKVGSYVVKESDGPMITYYAFVCSESLCSESVKGTISIRQKYISGDRPNIIFIIGDDIGYPHYGFMGNDTIKTPYMDELVENGVLFPIAHNSSPVCMPSLETMVTGLYPKDFRQGREYGDILTMPKALGEAGYVSYGAGKFWSGYDDAGFDSSLTGGRDVIGRRTMQPIYDFIDSQLDPGQNPDGKPFFIWYAARLPHLPLDAPPEFVEPYYRVCENPNKSCQLAAYYGNITRFDKTIGDLVAYLEDSGLRDDTLLLYVADNGWMMPNAKHHFSENGFRSVLWANFPGRIASGLRRDEFTHTIDILPTFMDYAGLQVPDNLEGKSLRPLLEGKSIPWREYLIGQNPDPARARRTPVGGRYLVTRRDSELLKFYSLYGREKLFDLTDDPNELDDLIGEDKYASFLPEFRRILDDWELPRWASGAFNDSGSFSTLDEMYSSLYSKINDRLAQTADDAEKEGLLAYANYAKSAQVDCGSDDIDTVLKAVADDGYDTSDLPRP